MKFRYHSLYRPLIPIMLLLFLSMPAKAEVRSLALIGAYATLPGDTAQIGRFESTDRIDMYFKFDLDSDGNEIAKFTWDVYNRYGDIAYSTEREAECAQGWNEIRFENAIPMDLGSGLQRYSVYASIKVDDTKRDTEFEIRVNHPFAVPGVMIEDVRLTPRNDNALTAELRGAAIPYTLEIDFRTENIISWARAEIRWLGITVDDFTLSRGLGTIRVDEGFNRFIVDDILAIPPYGSTPEAYFSVEVFVFGYYDTVTFPIESLPVSLMELRSTSGVENENAFSVGEGYLASEDGARSSYFYRTEPIIARLLTGGVVPENTTVLMQLKNVTDDSTEDFSAQLTSGVETPVAEIEIPANIDRTPGFYKITWTVVVGNVIFAGRTTSLTISSEAGPSIPTVLDLPGDATFTTPITWDISIESEPGLYATIITPGGIICRLMGNSLDTPLNVALLADMFESSSGNSGIPSGATLLTTEKDSLEGIWEYVRHAYLTSDNVYVYDYWLYRITEGEYQFLVAASVGNKNQVTETYAASNAILMGMDLGI